jgi:transposase
MEDAPQTSSASTIELPEDPTLCHELIRQLHDTVLQSQRRIEKLQHQLAQLLRARYGPRSERIDESQLMLFAKELLEAEPGGASDALVDEDATPPRKNGKRRGRKPLPKDLPRRRVVHELPADQLACPCCQQPRTRISEEVSEQLEYEPGSVYVIEHVRPTYACKNCEAHLITADKPVQPIDKGLPGPGLLAHVITSKYCDHLPLYRMERILGRHGVDLSRSTMCNWMAACAELLHPLYRLMVEDVLASKVVHTDDTVVPVQDKTRTKTRQGRAWVYVGDHNHPHTVFDYTPNRSRDGPLTFLESFTGYLQADAYSGYDALYTTGRVVEVACWAHTRRKFHESRETDPARAHAAIAMIRLLYKVEEEARDLSSDERTGKPACRALRQERSKPRLEQIKEWLEKEQITALPKSPIGQAIGYALNNWTALTRYVNDGDLHIDNNPAENAIRPIVLGRKNWLFAGSDKGGRTAAVLNSFIASCRRQEIDPFAYLRDVLTRFAACPINEIAQFLPHRWHATRTTEEA